MHFKRIQFQLFNYLGVTNEGNCSMSVSHEGVLSCNSCALIFNELATSESHVFHHLRGKHLPQKSPQKLKQNTLSFFSKPKKNESPPSVDASKAIMSPSPCDDATIVEAFGVQDTPETSLPPKYPESFDARW